MMRGRIADTLACPLALALLLGGCGAAETGPDPDAEGTTVPAVAPSIPSATAAPQVARKLFSFDGVDVDGNGFISAAEHAAGWSRTFEAMEADGDGVLTTQELDDARAAIGRLSLLSSERLIKAADQDGSGALTLAEYMAASNRSFQSRDGNGDGRLDRAEWTASDPGSDLPATMPRD
jgi:hypothetical protein